MTSLNTYEPNGISLTYGQMDANWDEIQRRTGQGWNDIVHSVTVRSGANAPTFTQFRDGIYAYEFAAATMNECFTNFHIRHDYDPTGGAYPGMIYPHIHWSSAGISVGTVRWGIEYTAARRDDSGNVGTLVFGTTQTIYIDHTVNAGEQYNHQVSEPADGLGIPLGTELQVDALVLCRFFRDAADPNDTFPDPIHMLTVDIHYPSDVSNTPNRQYPFG